MVSGPVYTRLTDDDLIALSLLGLPEAWKTLTRRYERLIRAVARRSGHPDPDGEAVYRETCERLRDELAALRKRRNLASWLVSTASEVSKADDA
jgi:DNA-directed RNA polymerase specialized sigma24 family protein